MLTGFTPFTGRNKEDLKRNLESGNYRFPKHIKLSLEGLDFLNCCLQHNPKDRLSWEDLMRHSYLNYDHTQFIQKVKANGQAVDQSVPEDNANELLLSYNEQYGMYSTVIKNDPHAQMDEKNAILINTKDPLYYQQTYEKTLRRVAEEKQEHAAEQIKNIVKLDEELGQSMIEQRWDNQQEVKEAVEEPVQPQPVAKEEPSAIVPIDVKNA